MTHGPSQHANQQEERYEGHRESLATSSAAWIRAKEAVGARLDGGCQNSSVAGVVGSAGEERGPRQDGALSSDGISAESGTTAAAVLRWSDCETNSWGKRRAGCLAAMRASPRKPMEAAAENMLWDPKKKKKKKKKTKFVPWLLRHIRSPPISSDMRADHLAVEQTKKNRATKKQLWNQKEKATANGSRQKILVIACREHTAKV
ncbi:MAG: hypothetical protein M1815_002958 [Lichina confinis]|nr:MAG: hypothetical protein M1815_002958 [Lichina confinis]